MFITKGTNRLILKWLKLWDNVVFMEGKALNKSKNKNPNNDHTANYKRPDWKFKKKEFVKSTFASRQALLEEDLVSEEERYIYIYT